MRIAFLGSGAFGLPTLASLASHHTLALIVTQPDKPAGRGKALTPTPVGLWASEHAPEVPLLKPTDINEPATLEQVRTIAGPGRVDAWVVIAFGQKLSAPLLDGLFAINLHASELPRWRGAAPINAAILAGDAHTGNSVITLAQRMDAGLILGTSRRVIEPQHTTGELHDLLASDGPALVLDVLARHVAGTLSPITQDERLVTKAGKLKKEDGWIDLAEPAEHARRRVHGLTPWPGVTVRLAGDPVKLLRVEALAHGPAGVPGQFVDIAHGLVACGQGSALRLVSVQPSGGKPMGWADFARGRTLSPGCVLDTGRPA